MNQHHPPVINESRIQLSGSYPQPTEQQQQNEGDQEAAHIIQQALEAVVVLDAYPKSVVDIFCLVLESGGADVSVLITAASLAIADAGIPMLDLVSSCYIVSATFPSASKPLSCCLSTVVMWSMILEIPVASYCTSF